MKGIVITEFLEMIEDKFSFETSERLLEMSDLPSGGIYTSVGTYDFQEMVTLVSNLSSMAGTPVSELLKEFGGHLFQVFVEKFPNFFKGIHSSFEFLPLVDSYVHMEVKKLYPDAETPFFSCTQSGPKEMTMFYRSRRNLPDLAEGLIRACIHYFGEHISLERESLGGDPPETRFILTKY
jgi:hypothetical protein